MAFTVDQRVRRRTRPQKGMAGCTVAGPTKGATTWGKTLSRVSSVHSSRTLRFVTTCWCCGGNNGVYPRTRVRRVSVLATKGSGRMTTREKKRRDDVVDRPTRAAGSERSESTWVTTRVLYTSGGTAEGCRGSFRDRNRLTALGTRVIIHHTSCRYGRGTNSTWETRLSVGTEIAMDFLKKKNVKN